VKQGSQWRVRFFQLKSGALISSSCRSVRSLASCVAQIIPVPNGATTRLRGEEKAAVELVDSAGKRVLLCSAKQAELVVDCCSKGAETPRLVLCSFFSG